MPTRSFNRMQLFQAAKSAERERLVALRRESKRKSTRALAEWRAAGAKLVTLSKQYLMNLDTADAVMAKLRAQIDEVTGLLAVYQEVQRERTEVKRRLVYLRSGYGHCEPTARFLLGNATVDVIFENRWSTAEPGVGSLGVLRGTFNYEGFTINVNIQPTDCIVDLVQ